MKKTFLVLLLCLVISGNLYPQSTFGWNKRNISSNNIKAIFFPSANTGWFIDYTISFNRLYYTSNSANSWNQVMTLGYSPGFNYPTIYFGSVSKGLINKDTLFFATTNGGLNWTENRLPDLPVLWEYSSKGFCLDSNYWWIAFGHSIINTTDAGMTWSNTTHITSYDPIWKKIPTYIQFVNSQTGFVSLYGNPNYFGDSLYRTTNGGLTWENIVKPSTGDNTKFYFINVNTGWILKEPRTIYFTSNAGFNWTNQYTGTDTGRFVSISGFSADTIFVYNTSKQIIKTTNAGINWSVIPVNITNDLFNGLFMISPLEGYLYGYYGSSGRLYKTISGGLPYFIAPGDGLYWKTQTNKQFTWNKLSVQNIRLDYSTNNGINWMNINQNYPSDSCKYNWQVPNSPSNQCRLKISSYLDTTLNEISKVFTIFTYGLTSPLGGESWQANTQNNISWNSQFLNNIKLDYTTNNGTSWNSIVQSISSSTGIYSWLIPYNITPSSQCKIRAIHLTNNDTLAISNTFSIFIGAAVPPSLFQPTNGASGITQPITLKWYKSNGASMYRLQIATDSNFTNLVFNDSTLTDTTKTVNRLSKLTPHYWRVKAKNEIGWGPYSGWWKFTSGPNLVPIPKNLLGIFNPNAGREFTQNYTFTSSGSTDPDGTIDSVQWFINYTKVSTDSSFTYAYPQGTTFIKLLVIDNEGARDSSTARVTRTTFRKYLGGPVYAGLSLTGDSVMYAIASEDKVYRMDIDGNILYNLSVNGNILSSSSIAYDTSVFIGSSDNNLYGFSRYGAPLWPVLPLGGQITATPTLDSVTNRIYIGTSNGFLQVVNRNTGNIAWSSFVGGSAVQGSAVITFDRKLVLFNAKGDLYGFDLNSTATTYTWFILSSDSVKTSPAIDNTGNIYIGTRGGKLKKITLPTGQAGNVVWEVNLGSPINTSPIIDETGNIYVGLQNGQFKKVNSSNGATIWTFNTTGSINTTPALSRLNKIYFGNTNGEIIALDSSKNVLWYYKDSSAIGNALLFSKGTVYAGTTAGRVIAIYDGTNLTDDPNLNPAAPMWGTYQGNNRRTGSQIDVSVGIFSPVTEIPKEYFVSNNYPNPFNPATRIKYGIPAESDVRMVIYDMLGREVKVLVNEKQKAGTYEVTFNASFLPSGVYFYRIVAKDFVQTKRMVLLK